MNKAILVGNLARDPELRTTPNGVSTCSFTVAVSRNYKNAEGGYDADFINCVAWRRNAEFVSQYFRKGSSIGVVGSIQVRNYDNKEGRRVYVTEVVVDEVNFVGSKSSNSDTSAPAAAANNSTPTNSFSPADGFIPTPADDDLPF